jgi:CheY-like chemotaxis protein
MEAQRILIVDDVGFNRIILSKILSSRGYEVTQAESGKKALQELFSNHYDLVVTDLMMQDMDGIELFDNAKAGNAPCPAFILCTAHGGADVVEDSMRRGFVGVLAKPVDESSVVEAVEKALRESAANTQILLTGEAAVQASELAEALETTPEELLAAVLERLAQYHSQMEAPSPLNLDQFVSKAMNEAE